MLPELHCFAPFSPTLAPFISPLVSSLPRRAPPFPASRLYRPHSRIRCFPSIMRLLIFSLLPRLSCAPVFRCPRSLSGLLLFLFAYARASRCLFASSPLLLGISLSSSSSRAGSPCRPVHLPVSLSLSSRLPFSTLLSFLQPCSPRSLPPVFPPALLRACAPAFPDGLPLPLFLFARASFL